MKFKLTKAVHRGAWFWGMYALRGTVVAFLGAYTFCLDWYKE